MDRLHEFLGTGMRRRVLISAAIVLVLLIVAMTPVGTGVLRGLALVDEPRPDPTASPIPSPTSSPFERRTGPKFVLPSPTEDPQASPGPTPTKGGQAGKTWVIAAAGDIACQPGEGGGGECQHAATANVIERLQPDAVLPLGDTQYDGALRDFQRSYDSTWGRFKEITHPAIGNHEYDTGGHGYFAYFGDRAGRPGAGFYSFDLGGWHLIALNSNCERVGGCHRGSTQERWLRNDLKKHSKQCTLAYWHHPRFSSGVEHGSEEAVGAFWEALYDHGADVVLSGHEHNYERFAPQTPGGRLDRKEGIRQFVVGTGGKSRYEFGRARPNSEVRNSTTYGVLRLALSPSGYQWKFMPARGSFTDSGRGGCH
jgi:hypothetical protein